MHESSLAKQIAQIALTRAARDGARAVRRVDGWIAESETISVDSLKLHFAAFTRGTAAEGAALNLRVTHVEARCERCGRSYAPEHHLLVCPHCGGVGGTLLGKTGMGVDALEVE